MRPARSIPVFVVFLQIASCSFTTIEAEIFDLGQIHSAWKVHEKNIKAFQLYVQSTRSITKEGIKRYGMKFPKRIANGVTLNSRSVFARAGQKNACWIEGTDWPPQKSDFAERSYSAVFDGGRLFELYEDHQRTKSGLIRHKGQGVIENKTPVAISVWLSPSGFLGQTYDLHHPISISDGPSRNVKVLQFVGNNRDQSVATVHVDMTKNFAPVRLIIKDTHAKTDVKIKYESSPSSIARISSWTLNTYDQAGKLHSSETSFVKRSSINEKIADGKFKILFPVGMYLREIAKDWTPTYLVSTGDGKLRPVSDKEYTLGIKQESSTSDN